MRMRVLESACFKCVRECVCVCVCLSVCLSLSVSVSVCVREREIMRLCFLLACMYVSTCIHT